MNEDSQKAIEILKNGGVVVFPTDTAFGIGCRIDDEKAVSRLFAIKKRPMTKATPVLVSSVAMALEYLQPIPNEVQTKLIEKYWPGALTILLPCQKEKASSLVRGKSDSLGVRQPNHPELLAIIESIGVPIIGTSANIHGEKTPHRSSELNPEMVQQVDYVLPGDCLGNASSTIIDCTKEPWHIVRAGGVEVKL